jgi:hypothetical protein
MKDALFYLNNLTAINGLNEFTKSCGLVSHFDYIITNPKIGAWRTNEIDLIDSIKLLNRNIEFYLRIDLTQYAQGDIADIYDYYGSRVDGILFDNAHYVAGPITRLLIVNPGADYSVAPLLTITGGGGSGATATAYISGVNEIIDIFGGFGYSSTPTVAFNNTATATLASRLGSIISVSGLSAPVGEGYTVTGTGMPAGAKITTVNSSTEFVLVIPNGTSITSTNGTALTFSAGGSGAAATAVVINNRVAGIDITDTGSNYTCAPTITISGGSPSLNATANFTVGIGQVTKVVLNSGGTGYYSGAEVTTNGVISVAQITCAGPVNRDIQIMAAEEARSYNYAVGFGVGHLAADNQYNLVDVIDNNFDNVFNPNTSSIPKYPGDFIVTYRWLLSNTVQNKIQHYSEELLIASTLQDRGINRISVITSDTVGNYNTLAGDRSKYYNLANFWKVDGLAFCVDTDYYSDAETTVTVSVVTPTVAGFNNERFTQTSNNIVTRSDGAKLTITGADLTTITFE